MKILAIDTTGFTTSVSVVENGMKVIFLKNKNCFIKNSVWSDFVVELPDRHKENLLSLFKSKKINWKNIDTIAVSSESGISNCILVGTTFASLLSQVFKKPLIFVDHILAHMYSGFLERDCRKIKFPILVFSASGSHSDFSLLKEIDKCEILTKGVPKINRDEVDVFIGIGKVFDQIGRRIGILTPTDSDVKKLMKICSQGNPDKYNFKKYYKGDILDLDFSGFIRGIDSFLVNYKKEVKILSQKVINDVVASFQKSVMNIIVDKIFFLANKYKVKEIHLVGGVSCDRYLRNTIKERAKKYKTNYICRFPSRKIYSLDNAAMIASLAYYQQKYNIHFKNYKVSITK